MLEDFLSKLGASTRITVGVSISPGIGLEMIEIDRLTGTVIKYGSKPLEYNNSTREITDYDQLRFALEELFEDLHIPKRSNVVLSLPNVHFGLVTLPLLLTDEAITNAILSEVEQSYIFKRQEAVVSWTEILSNVNTENRLLAYTAIQKTALDQIVEICDEIGCLLVGIETSYSSLFRALHFSGIAKDQMKENVSWNLMVIRQNNYSIISVNNKKIVEYYEEPLALKSFVDDEIYNAIRSSAQLTLAGLPANYLFIISETDLVSAEVLSMKIAVDSAVKFLECNKFIQNELLPVNLNILPKLALQITPEAIGAAVQPFCDFPLKLNIVKDQDLSLGSNGESDEAPTINLGNLEVELTPAFVRKMALIFSSIMLLPAIIILLFLSQFIIPKENARLETINSKIQNLNTDIQKYQDTSQNSTFDLKMTINDIVAQNKIKLTYYEALGVSIPNKLWITYYELNGSGKIDIRGQASEVKSVYTFYKSMKQLVNNSDIRLYKLEVTSDSIDEIVVSTSNSAKLYNFEITNMTDTELNPPKTNDDKNQKPEDANKTQGPEQPKSPFGNKPIFGPVDNNQAPNNEQTVNPPPSNPPSEDGKLPSNLKKIEKF